MTGNDLRRWGTGLAALVVSAVAAPVAAQQGAGFDGQGIRMQSPVLTLDGEQLFETTLWGKRLRSEAAEAFQQLQEENDRIANMLIDEEKALTEKRATLPAQAFRIEADAFDKRATEMRTGQNAKAQALNQKYDAARQAFSEAVAPLLDEFLASRGAVVVLDKRVIIRGLSNVDVTVDIARHVDARLGAGPQTTTP